MASPSFRLADLLHVLAERDVEFIVVGMAAGVLEGAPLVTGDLDIVHRRTPAGRDPAPALVMRG